jgi:predicted small secreted protein
MSRNVVILCLLVFTATGLSACNTAEGFGKDLSGAGDAIQGVFN